MTRRRFDLTLTSETADRLDRLITEQKARDVENFMPPRPVTQILEMVIRLGLELHQARENRRISQTFPNLPREPIKGHHGKN